VGWLKFMDELISADPGGPHDPGRVELLQFFGSVGTPAVAGEGADSFDALKVLKLYRDRFFDRVVDVEHRFDRLQQIFDFQYRRRNLLLTFVLSLLVAALLGLPTQTIYTRAKALSAEETAALVATAQGLYQRADSMARVVSTDTATNAAAREAAQELRDVAAALRVKVRTGSPTEVLTSLPGLTRMGEIWGGADALLTLSWYLLGCILTAVMVCFGAPFWNDILTAIGSRARPSPEARDA
jgi:hypothetical protein